MASYKNALGSDRANAMIFTCFDCSRRIISQKPCKVSKAFTGSEFTVQGYFSFINLVPSPAPPVGKKNRFIRLLRIPLSGPCEMPYLFLGFFLARLASGSVEGRRKQKKKDRATRFHKSWIFNLTLTLPGWEGSEKSADMISLTLLFVLPEKTAAVFRKLLMILHLRTAMFLLVDAFPQQNALGSGNIHNNL